MDKLARRKRLMYNLLICFIHALVVAEIVDEAKSHEIVKYAGEFVWV